MRFYRIELSNTATGAPITPASLSGSGLPPGVITSLNPDGSTNTAALNIELDLPVYAQHNGDGSAYVRIWGLAISEIGQAFNLNKQTIKIYGGMSKGYPLADPTQQGLLIQGTILQAFGNWIGTDMTLDMYVGGSVSGNANPQQPSNYSYSWAQGEPLSAMIQRTLNTVLPGVQQRINISPSRVGNQNPAKVGVYTSLPQFAQFVRQNTQGQLSPDDQGVIIATDGQTVQVFEGSPTSPNGNVKQIRFQDFLGQPTWSEPQVITAKLVMRGDLNISDTVQFPQGLLVTTTSQALSSFGGTGSQNPANNMTFGGNGQFSIIQMQHWGNFRQPDAMSWNTTIWATPVVPGTGS